MATKLKHLKINEGSLVDKGSNPEADVVLFKRASNTKGGEMNKAGKKVSGSRLRVLKEGLENMRAFVMNLGGLVDEVSGIEKGVDSMPISEEVLKSLPDEVKTKLEKMEKAQEEFDEKLKAADKTDEIEELKTKNTELTKTIEDGKDKNEPTELEKAMEGASENVKKQIEAMNEKVEKAETIAKEEREARITKEFEDKAKDLENVGSVEDISKMLRTAHDVSKEAGEKLEETLKAAHEKIKASKLLEEIGSENAGVSGATNKLESLAKAKAEKDNITFEEAYAKVIESEEGQELYKQHTQEVN